MWHVSTRPLDHALNAAAMHRSRFRTALPRLLLALCTLAALPDSTFSGAPATFTALLADGSQAQGELVAVAAGWKLALRREDGTRQTLDAAKLVRLTRNGGVPDRPTGPQVVLANGDRIRGSLLSMDEEKLRLRSETAGIIELPLECVYGVLVAAINEPEACTELVDAIERRNTDADELWLANRDRLRGTIVSIDERQITLDQNGTELRVPRGQVVAIVLNRELISCPPIDTLHTVAVLDDGSELRLVSAALEGTTLRGQTAFETAVSVPLERVRMLEFHGGAVAYLSDLQPASYRHMPYLGGVRYGWQADRAIGGSPLSLRGVRYRKGIGVHAHAELVYRLDGQYRLFRAVVGVDDNTGGGGSVVFVVLVDGKERFRSERLTGHSAPVEVNVPLAGAQELRLVVEFADYGDVLDHADWADAYLVRN